MFSHMCALWFLSCTGLIQTLIVPECRAQGCRLQAYDGCNHGQESKRLFCMNSTHNMFVAAWCVHGFWCQPRVEPAKELMIWLGLLGHPLDLVALQSQMVSLAQQVRAQSQRPQVTAKSFVNLMWMARQRMSLHCHMKEGFQNLWQYKSWCFGK